MTTRRRMPPLLAAALLLAPAASAAGPAALDSLVAAERAFARMSLDRGVRDAFLHWMAPDGVIFRPRAVNARQAWESRGPVAARLAWSPVYAEVAAAGDLGVTTGPWELRPDDPKLPAGHGHFVSVWQRQGDGEWRVAVDIGIGHAKPDRGVGMDEVTPGPARAARRAPGPPPDLMALDRAWTEDARARGPVAAFARRAARDVRFYRDAVTPVTGAAGAREMVRLLPGATRWDPEAQRVSLSGDLGCTYGMLERRAPAGAPPDSSVYLHVWRREAGGWKVSLALETALPKRRAKP
jgi:ketosteroid isomerase-like protein